MKILRRTARSVRGLIPLEVALGFIVVEVEFLGLEERRQRHLIEGFSDWDKRRAMAGRIGGVNQCM